MGVSPTMQFLRSVAARKTARRKRGVLAFENRTIGAPSIGILERTERLDLRRRNVPSREPPARRGRGLERRRLDLVPLDHARSVFRALLRADFDASGTFYFDDQRVPVGNDARR